MSTNVTTDSSTHRTTNCCSKHAAVIHSVFFTNQKTNHVPLFGTHRSAKHFTHQHPELPTNPKPKYAAHCETND